MTTQLEVPTTQPSPPRRHRGLLVVLVVMAFAATAAIAFAWGRQTAPDAAADPGAAISEAVMTAWATGDPADIAAIYADDAVFVVDGDPLAEGIDQITEMIGGTENTYEQIGPVSSLESDGDRYVSFLVEVVGPGHPTGDPVVGFYRVRDGMVIRHVVIDAEHV
jgi:ketosteroid isomerase-like protein